MNNNQEKAPLKAPFEIFTLWLEKAKQSPDIKEPYAMCLATVDENNCPSARMVLLKGFDEKGFCFFTNLISRKGKDLSKNPQVALCFYWMSLGLQVRIEGKAEKVSDLKADEYFKSRHRNSQIGAWASLQSQKMNDWQEFERKVDKVNEDFIGNEVPRPPFWSGFRVVPIAIEFWQEGEFRLHKREFYTRTQNDDFWQVFKLYP
jgi:pyridoxamine 5'-phosphate oxidase